MNIEIEPGKYVVAVSGGVDSMVLLDMLTKQSGLELVVAHFDHGIRKDSSQDAQVVATAAKAYNLPFETKQAKLVSHASEALARARRYEFLEQIKSGHKAKAIITAHHQDDIIETMMINVLRGTNRKGLSSLKNTKMVVRPLLGFAKSDIKQYASSHQINWHEDSTNTDETYLRNYLRNQVVVKLSSQERKKWLDIYNKMLGVNEEIDQEITLLAQDKETINRTWLLQFPNVIAGELIVEFLRQNKITISQRLVQDTVIFIKNGYPNSYFDVNKDYWLVANKSTVQLTHK